MIVPFRILANVAAQLTAALSGVEVFRSRSRAVAEGVQQAVLVRIEECRGELYTTGGDCDWTVAISVIAFSRAGDEDSAAVLALAHNALIADMTIGGIAGLFFNPAFTMAVDAEDTDEDLSAMTALYNFQITTGGSSATIA
ncbi:MAG: hypothetical protein YHS30scaffold667_21 [Phage 65_10]|nr:MAG: hypothetical protein YHS30scaffold667_21 [Phage 65_10]